MQESPIRMPTERNQMQAAINLRRSMIFHRAAAKTILRFRASYRASFEHMLGAALHPSQYAHRLDK